MDNKLWYKSLPLVVKNGRVTGVSDDCEDIASDILIRFGKNVRKLRSSLGITQEGLALKAGLHRNYISDMERGTRNVSLRAINKVANALGVNEKDLF